MAVVEITGKRETVHVKNTGRCKELLLSGSRVYLEKSGNPNRKTAYDLVAVEKAGLGLVNIDSQAPNKVAFEWLSAQGFALVKAEQKHGSSRMDFYMEGQPTGQLWEDFSGGKTARFLLEVKGCTLEMDGVGYFPDAPTERGVRHLRELAGAAKEGFTCVVAFVIQMEGIREVRPNWETHPEFGAALEEAKAAGVRVLFLCCSVEPHKLLVQEALWG